MKTLISEKSFPVLASILLFSTAETIVDLACNNGAIITLRESIATVIQSPGFNDSKSYPNHVYCSWTVQCTHCRRIRITFDVLSILPTFNCAFDGLEIYDGSSPSSPVIVKYCKVSSPSAFETNGPAVHIVFYSGGYTPHRFQGFRLNLQEVGILEMCNNESEATCHNGACVNKTSMCNRFDDCGDGTDEENCDDSSEETIECGLTPISPVLGNGDRIVGGRAAVPGSWPWQCSLRRRGMGPQGHLCGAVLLNLQWIVTAAHCFRKLRSEVLWTAHFGKYYKNHDEDNEQMRYLQKIIIHPEYEGSLFGDDLNTNSKTSDIALAKLNAPVTVQPNVHPPCLPPWRSSIRSETMCHVTGWGATYGTGTADVLKQAAVPIVSNEKCSKFYKDIINLTESMICAGYDNGGHDSCGGDSGGPLVLSRDERWYLVGIVSTGGTCAAARRPGIYTSVSFFKWWIEETLSIN